MRADRSDSPATARLKDPIGTRPLPEERDTHQKRHEVSER